MRFFGQFQWFCMVLIIFISCKEETKVVTAKPIEDVDGWEYEVLWSDEFDGKAVDTTQWNFETGDHGWGNNEWQNYTDGENAEVSEGTLKIISRKQNEGQKVGDYTSARITSKKKFKYGHMAIRAKMPESKGNGLWPAIWMLGDDIKDIGWPGCGEIDIMEYVSFDPDHVIQTIHSTANNHTKSTQISTGELELKTIEEEFHIYGILWTESQLQFYIDDIENITLSLDKPENPTNDNWPFDKEYYFILNMAVGGAWGGEKGVDDTIFPAQMEIDYVRVYNL